MKKFSLFALITLACLGLFAFLNQDKNNSQSASSQFYIFKQFDSSNDDNEELDTTSDNQEDNSEDWISNFIQTHKTPWSKTIEKD